MTAPATTPVLPRWMRWPKPGGCEINKSKWQGLYGIAQVDGRKVMLLKPLTYMNLSGQSIAPAAAFYKIPAQPHYCVVR